MLFGIEWSARALIDAEYLYHGSDPTREPRLGFADLAVVISGTSFPFSFPSSN